MSTSVYRHRPLGERVLAALLRPLTPLADDVSDAAAAAAGNRRPLLLINATARWESTSMHGEYHACAMGSSQNDDRLAV